MKGCQRGKIQKHKKSWLWDSRQFTYEHKYIFAEDNLAKVLTIAEEAKWEKGPSTFKDHGGGWCKFTSENTTTCLG